jgi:AraC family transcriptional regulator of adaptative response/methylated-DNA-[protein]-cysteine methyltransferase
MAETIRYGFARTNIAALLVATSDDGLVAVLMRDHPDEEALAADLAERLPDADRVRDNKAVRQMVEAVTSFVERPTSSIDQPLDIRATGFFASVYRAVLEIPFGETRTFGEIAAAAGSPNAARAVGSACTRNPIEFAIPCHRVLRSDGRWSGGSAWGDWRQSVIVGREAAAVRTRKN